MTAPQASVQRALQDIETIRRAIDGIHQQESQLTQVKAPGVQMIVLGAAGGLSTLLFLLELLLSDFNTLWLMSQYYIRDIQKVSIFEIGFFLIIILLGFYFIIWRASAHQGEKVDDYIARNFRYLKNFSLIWDLFLKFSILSLIILAAQPHWIAPLLFLFTADYCFQGRFFILPLRLSYALGLLCVLGAALQFLYASPFLAWPFAGFSVVALASLFYVWKNSRKRTD